MTEKQAERLIQIIMLSIIVFSILLFGILVNLSYIRDAIKLINSNAIAIYS